MASKRKLPTSDLESLRLGGVYIPPFKMRRLEAKLSADVKSEPYQRLQWEALRKSIVGPINKVNRHNIAEIAVELFNENIIRGRGLLCRAIMRSQLSSPSLTPVHCALVCIINSKMPEIGDLLCRRVVASFQRFYRRNDRLSLKCSCLFIGHLINTQVVHELLGLQIIQLLLSQPTNDSIETVKGLLLCAGSRLKRVAPDAMRAVYKSLRDILQETDGIDVRVQYELESLFKAFGNDFRDHPQLEEDLDLVDDDDLICHNVHLTKKQNTEKMLDIFHFDAEWDDHEADYIQIRKEILGDDSGSESDSDSDGDSDADSSSSEEDEEEGGNEGNDDILDMTDESVMALRRQIYLTMVSSLTAEEMSHKMMSKFEGRHKEVSHMCVEACCHERSYRKQYGVMAERLCKLSTDYETSFDALFQRQYGSVHQLDTNKIRNVAKLMAHLLCSDALDWTVLQCLKLNDRDTNPSKRIFVKILFQEMASFLGKTLKKRLSDSQYGSAFDGLFPRDNPKDTRFAINFFTTIGLGGLTEEMRAHLAVKQKEMAQRAADELESDDDDSSDSDSDSDSESDSDSSSSSSSDDSEAEREYQRKKRRRDRKRREESERRNDRRSKPRIRRRSSERRDRRSRSSRRKKRRSRSSTRSSSRSLKKERVESASRSPSRGRWGR